MFVIYFFHYHLVPLYCPPPRVHFEEVHIAIVSFILRIKVSPIRLLPVRGDNKEKEVTF